MNQSAKKNNQLQMNYQSTKKSYINLNNIK